MNKETAPSATAVPAPAHAPTSQDTAKNERLEEYIQSMTEKEHKAYMIAKTHLGSSFDLKKSTGFVQWDKK